MFPVKADHLRRVSFATRLFPKIKSSLGLDTTKLKSTDQFDGEIFCGGRSKNRDLLSFFGLIAGSQRGASSFVQLPLFRRSIKKLTAIVEQELQLVGGHEVLLPTLIPQRLWRQSKRYERQQNALDNVYSFTDKAGNEMLLGPTFEESMTQLVGDLEPSREEDLPLLLYQTSNKFRFEPNPRFGLIRSNEFLMNDLYSFDSSLDGAKRTYELMTRVYERIFNKLDLDCLRFESGPGSIGGKYSHEYQLPVPSGEDTVISCANCGHAYNKEMLDPNTDQDKCLKCDSKDISPMQALELGHTFLLSDTYSKPMGVKYSREDGTKVDFEMGSYGLGLTRILAAALDLYSIIPKMGHLDEQQFLQMRWPTGTEPFKFGIVVPAKRSKQHHAGSTEFAEKIVGRILESTADSSDIIVEDRDKEGILRRLYRLQSLGVPNIIVIGQRFLQDIPEIEFLRLDGNKQGYTQHWLNEDQLFDLIKEI